MVDRLAEDHATRALAEGLARLPGLRVDLASVQTNIVILNVERGRPAASAAATAELVAGCAAQGEDPCDRSRLDPVRNHKDIDAEDIARTRDAFAEITRTW